MTTLGVKSSKTVYKINMSIDYQSFIMFGVSPQDRFLDRPEHEQLGISVGLGDLVKDS